MQFLDSSIRLCKLININGFLWLWNVVTLDLITIFSYRYFPYFILNWLNYFGINLEVLTTKLKLEFLFPRHFLMRWGMKITGVHRYSLIFELHWRNQNGEIICIYYVIILFSFWFRNIDCTELSKNIYYNTSFSN